jgi:two-component system LytT family response regulator
MIRAVVVEDEPHARRNLREYSAGIDWLALVGEAADGRDAVQLIDRLEPDLVFLDVELPEMSGLNVLEAVRHSPEVVFTTAYDRYALAAFEAGALDYLLKPFGRERFARTLERVRRRLMEASPPATERARAAFEAPLRRLFVRAPSGIVPVEVRTVRHVEAAGDYVTLHCEGGEHLLHMTLADLERRLDPDTFVRVHRSHLVNLDAVREIVDHDGRRLAVRLRDGSEIVASRSASERLRRLAR